MGVTFVTHWDIEEGKNVPQSLEELQRTIEKIGAKKSGLFCVECETYQTVNINQGKPLNIISNSEYPLSKFALFEDGASLIADAMLPNFLVKMRLFWQQRKGAKIECKGHRYILNDFLFKIGVVTHGSNTRGIAVEIEYTPCLYVKECWNLLLEIFQNILGPQAPTSENPLFQKLKSTDIIYTAEHTSLQYIEVFNNFRKVTS
ncbi:mediator of RNA polymerase II transcription subunit 20-like [Styela clava]|uniref:mediator of RNA polymerase II transcription subunit 20-like n=1 Tax=Styela clava TaxID=7725 RepID=UPI0019395F48|nr:mediator of RNA polymerase II transcription subunit 20-like [Styela clava]